MQDVPLPGRARIRAGAKVLGQVAAVKRSNHGATEIAFRFDMVAVGKRRIPVTTSLRALATMMDVAGAQVPPAGPDRGTSAYSWTTQQIGGETVYHGGGPVTHGSTVVGKSVADGVLVEISAVGKCDGDTGNNSRPQALWVFSSDACGLYDLPNVSLVHAGRTEPRGEIRLMASRGTVQIQAGSGMLLRVLGN